MKLKPDREKFARCIANGMNQTDAYRASFNTENMKAHTIHKRAYEMMSSEDVKSRVNQMQKKLEEKSLWTREKSVKALIEAYKIAKDKEQSSAMTNAVRELNVMHGYNAPQKHEISGANGDPLIDVSKLSIDVIEQILVAKDAANSR